MAKKNFYEGLQQVLAFSIFGFDGLCLWHMFATEIEENAILNYANAMGELISGFKLPIFYLTTKILDEKELRMKCFKPSQIAEEGVEYFIDWLNSYWMYEENRNPRLKDSEIKNRRKILKVLLKIPV
jgi:hypothetical protein